MEQESWAGKALDGEAAANSWDDNLSIQLITRVHLTPLHIEHIDMTKAAEESEWWDLWW